MTAIDLTIIAIVGFSIAIFYRNRQIIKGAGHSFGSILLLLGLSITGSFYFYDLLVMHFLPQVSPQVDVMKTMTDLHLNYNWVVTLLAVGSIVVGFTFLTNRVSLMVGQLEARSDELKEELERRSLSEDALRASEQSFRRLYDETPVMLHSIDREHRITGVNNHWLATLGYERTEVIGRKSTDFMDEKSRKHAINVALPRFFRTGESTDLPYVYFTKGGETVDIILNAYAERDETGTVVGSRAALVNVTRRNRAEADAMESRRILLSAIEHMSDGFAVFDGEDRLILCNEQYKAMYPRIDDLIVPGVKFTDLASAASERGQIVDFSPREENQEYADFRREARERGKSVEVLTAEGRWIETRDQLAENVGWVAIRIDVTERRQAEDKFRQAQKMEAVGQLTGGVAHDFNNLLAIIVGNAELLEHRIGNQDELAHAISRAASRGANLTQRLLAFSRRQSLQPRAIDVEDLIAGMMELLRPFLGESVDLKTEIHPGLWHAMADPGELENALVNLAINARDAMPNGGTLTIESSNINLTASDLAAEDGVGPGRFVMLTARDTGSGMPADVLQHAFEPFFTTKEVGEGSGLGLSMVYGFVKQTGGFVTIHSEEGNGTTVKLYLPRAEWIGHTAVHEKESATRTQPSLGKTILVVEDDTDVRKLIVRMLRDLDCEVCEAEDGMAALGLLGRTPRVDLLLTDIVLPGGMAGPDLADRARRLRPGTKVLYMSGYANKAVREGDTVDDGVAILNKPFRKHRLIEAVRNVLTEPVAAEDAPIPIASLRRSGGIH